MLVLGIETSCDETAAALVRDGCEIVSSVIASQIKTHERFGGVVPELASREHLDKIVPIVEEAFTRANIQKKEIDGIAVTVGPGLVGSLLVGVSYAKAMAFALEKPLVGVNHIEGHIYSVVFENPPVEYPALALVVSGGHTNLFFVPEPGKYKVVARTRDDAAGEAFDKVARFLGLGYPGGPLIDRLATEGDPAAIPFPRPMLDQTDDFSFSGLKTAVVQWVRKHPDAAVADVAASFQAAVVDVLVAKLLRAAHRTGIETIVIGGGVAANSSLRAHVADGAARAGLRAVLPSPALCTDNAAMVGACAWWRFRADGPTPLDDGVDPALRIG
jgi:tRNA N6-adenosine threonylcarbamoyltransferase